MRAPPPPTLPLSGGGRRKGADAPCQLTSPAPKSRPAAGCFPATGALSPPPPRTPGRTQELVFFTGGDNLNVVDMPGYGYAAAAKSKIAAWTALIEAYLRGRANLARVYVLVDARHRLKDADEPPFKALGPAGGRFKIVLYRAD